MASRNEREVGIRLSVKDAEIAKRALAQFGSDGEAALRRIERTSVPANKGLLNLSNAILRGKEYSRDFAVEATRSFLGPVAAIATAAGAVGLLRDAIERVRKIADLGDLAERIGVDVTALQGLQATVRESGNDVDTLNGSLETFATNLGKASQEGGDLKKIFDLNKVEISGDTLTDLKSFAGLVKNAATEQDRLRLVTLAVGKGGKEMVDLLSGGAAGIGRAADEMERLGGGVTDDDVQRARDITAELAQVQIKLDGARDKFSLLIAPVALGTLQSFNEFLEDTRDLLTDIQNLDLKGIAELIAGDPETRGGGLVGWVGDNLFGGPDKMAPTAGELFPEKYADITVNGGNRTTRNWSDFSSYWGASDGDGSTILPRADDKDADAARKRIEDVTAALNEQLAQLTMTDREVAISNELSRAKVDAASDEGKAIAELTGKYYDQKQAVEGINSAANFMASSLEGAFEKLIDGSSSLSDVIGDLADTLAKAVLQATLLGEGPLASLLGTKSDTSGETGGVFGSIISGLMSLFEQNALGGVYASPGLSAYSGQVVSRPTLFPFAQGIGMMGEAGAEAIMPLKRTASGALGVQVADASPAAAASLKVDVHNYGDASVDVRQNGGSLEVIIDKTVQKLGGQSGSGTSRMLNARGARTKLTRRG